MFRQTSSLVDRKPFGTSRVAAEHPPSPPDTESISSHMGLYATPQRRPSHPDNFMLPTIPATPDMHESAGARFRRLAGIPTSQSGSREFRGASRPQTRWLVVLMPPDNLIAELSVGHRSPGKLSSGLLVPLFPTLFAQLAAIAKEFNLPSTTGLCLYLHLPDAPDAPRITDDVWPLLWARHLHTDDASLPLGLPVAGRVQFDIDIPSARWYPMWFSHVSRKELVPDLARAIPSSPKPMPSPFADTSRARGVPRPLALAPRPEPVVAVQIDSTPSPTPSPAIPKSASKETVEKVRRWSALVTPEPASIQPDVPGAPADDSAPLPTDDTIALATDSTAVEDAEPEPLNLDDFQWSVTSAGPPSPASSCATTASSRVPSIHLLERAEGSVILTPTTATSWGPQYDSDAESELELDIEWRVRSPDMGERAEGSVLLTPSTATSWGAPLSYPPTPAQWAAMHELVRSPDLGERAEGSVLLTPSTATSWGAPLSYPPTPAEWYALREHIARSPDLGRRAEGSVLLTPSTATSWGAPLSYPPTPAGARPREWVPSPGLGDSEYLSPGRAGRMSTMQWGAEVETEEEAYARMGLAHRWEFGWPTASPLPLSSVHEEAEEEAGSIQVELLREDAFGSRSVSLSGHDSVSVNSREAYETQYGRDAAYAGSHDEMESLYDGAFGGDEERDPGQVPAFEFELELESPQVGRVTEERSYAAAVEESHGQEILDSFGQEAEVSFSQEMDESYRQPFEYAPEDVSASEAEDNASEASIEDGVFEYSYPDSAAQPSFPVSVSASDDVTGFPDLDVVVEPESPSLDTVMQSRAVPASVHTTAVVTSTTVPTRSYGAYPYIVLYPSTYPHLDIYPSAPGATLQTKAARPTVDVRARSLKSVELASSPVESTSSWAESLPSQATRSPSSSRKSSLSITVPTTSSRSRSTRAVNPADKRSAEWSRNLPPVPPVPHSLRSSIGSISSLGSDERRGSASSLGSVREESVRSVRDSVGSMQERSVEESQSRLQSERLQERRPSITHDGTEFELSVPSKKLLLQPSSSAYPYRYPHNLGQLYPPKEGLGYPANLERIYPVVRSVPRVRSLAVRSLAVVKTTRSEKSLAVSSNGAYPVFNLYPAVYPHNLDRIYPSVLKPIVSSSVPATVSAPLVPARAPAPVLPPSVPTPASKTQYVAMSRGYPFIDLYPAVYPHNLESIYPSVSPKPIVPSVSVPTSVPSLPVPTHVQPSSTPAPTSKTQYVAMSRGYPFIDLYPAVYPHNLESIYPSVPKEVVAPKPAQALALVPGPKQAKLATSTVPVRTSNPQYGTMSRGYPFIDLYPAVYPHNLECLYPSVPKKVVAPKSAQVLASISSPKQAKSAPSTPPALTSNPQHVAMSRGYPFIDLYPAVYPHNLECLYPSVPKKVVAPKSAQVLVSISSPKQVKPTPSTALARISNPQHVATSRGYPFIDLYPAVYPHNLECIYPSIPKKVAVPKQQAKPAISASSRIERSLQPTLESAPLAYPFNLDNLYPSVKPASKPTSAVARAPKVTPPPAVPSAKSQGPIVKSSGVRLARAYPNIELYAPVYPFNLDIYPPVGARAPKTMDSRVKDRETESSSKAAERGNVEGNAPPARKRKTHAQLCAETWRKSHAQLVAEVFAESAPKSHAGLKAEVLLDELPVPEASPESPQVMITPVPSSEQDSEVEPALEPEVVPELKPAPVVAPLRRQRSGTIMRPPPSGPLPVPPVPALPQGIDLGRSRSMLEARTKMFERSPSRSQTDGPQGPQRTLVRQKSASFERAKSLFHTPEEDHAQSEGSRTPPRPTRRVSKLDMSKFRFA